MSLLLHLASVAWAGANHVPEWSLATDEETKQSIRTLGFTTSGEAKTWARKIAIPQFVIRYDKTQYDKDTGVTQTLKFADDASYVALTDALYQHVVDRFTAAGFEVVGKDAVMKSAAYASLKGEPGDSEGAERIRGVPSGMKDLGTRLGQPTQPDQLAALNRELGTDAVVAIYANFGLCTVDHTPDTGMSGTKPCLRGNLTLPGLSMLFVGGAVGDGAAVKPAWTSRAYKELVEFEYQKAFNAGSPGGQVADIYDAALISPLDATSFDPSAGWWVKYGSNSSDGAAYAQGIDDMLDVAFTLAMETYYDKNAAAMAAAKVTRPPRAPAHESAKPLTKEQIAANQAKLQAELDKRKAALTAESGVVAKGSVICYQMPASGAQLETLMKRGVEGTTMTEESVALQPLLGAIQNGATYTLTDGTFQAVDAKGNWTGSGTYEGPAHAWTSWKNNIQVKSGATVDVTGTVEAAGLRVVSVTKGPDGTVFSTTENRYTTLDAAACDAAWAKAIAFKPTPPGAAPDKKKGKK